jgi:serine protease Do
MFNLKGEVIGVSASILSPTGSSVGIGFAIPSNSVMQIIKQLKDQGEVVRGWIGVSVQDLSEEIAQSIKIEKNKGAFVNEVVSGSPADVAGILPTDIILKIDEQEVNEMKILPKIISKYPVGKIIKLTVFRRGKIKIIPVKVSKLREDEATKKIENVRPQEKKLNAKTNDQILGIGFAALNSSLKKANNIDSNVQGILITEISLKSEAASKGLILGDIILSINQIPISSVEEFKEAILNATKQSKKLYFFIKRGSNKFGLALNAK